MHLIWSHMVVPRNLPLVVIFGLKSPPIILSVYICYTHVPQSQPSTLLSGVENSLSLLSRLLLQEPELLFRYKSNACSGILSRCHMFRPNRGHLMATRMTHPHSSSPKLSSHKQCVTRFRPQPGSLLSPPQGLTPRVHPSGMHTQHGVS